MLKDTGPDLIASGYHVCALAPRQKRPTEKGWQHHPLTPAQCAAAQPDAGVGIICGIGEPAVYGLDFDIPADFECAEALREKVFDILGVPADDRQWRVGMPPKFLIAVRGPAGMTKQVTPWRYKGGDRARFEFLGAGQQFVALAIHPETGASYEWYGEPFFPYGDCPLPSAAFLPEITAEKLAALQKAFVETVEEFGWEDRDIGKPLYADSDLLTAGQTPADDDFVEASPDELVPHPKLGLTLDDAGTFLSDFPGNEDYETWLKVGMALHHEFDGAYEAELLWDKWSSGASNYRGFQDLDMRWQGFGRSARPVTMAFVAKHWREKHYDYAAELNEAGRARRLYELHKGRLLYAHDTGVWHRWSGVHWEPLSQCQFEVLCRDILGDVLRADLRRMSKGADSTRIKALTAAYNKFRSSASCSAVAKEATRVGEFLCLSSDFNKDNRYLGVANGDVDLTTGEFLPPDPQRMISRFVPVPFDSEAKCPLWEATVKAAFQGSQESVDFVQRIFGYALTGNPVEEKFFVFHGSGSNGKSTIVNTVRRIFGGYAVTMQDSTVTSMGGRSGGNGGAARSDIVELMGKRLALIPETEESASMREATVKRLVSLDELTARGVYAKSSVSFTPTAVPIIVTNYMPDIRGTDEGIWRRIVAVGFRAKFTVEEGCDVHRQDELRKEFPGILNWLIEGALAYQKTGLAVPRAIKDETAGLRADMDFVQDWLNDCCVFSEGALMPARDALASWQAWAKRNGYDSLKFTSKRLGRQLHGKDIASERRRVDGKVSVCYVGVKLADDFEDMGEEKE